MCHTCSILPLVSGFPAQIPPLILQLFTNFYHYFTTFLQLCTTILPLFYHSLSTFYHLPLRARPRFGSGPIALMNFTVCGVRVRANSRSGKIYYFFTTFYHFFTTTLPLFYHSLSTFYNLPLRARPRFGSGPIALMNFTVCGARVRANSRSGEIYHCFYHFFTTF